MENGKTFGPDCIKNISSEKLLSEITNLLDIFFKMNFNNKDVKNLGLTEDEFKHLINLFELFQYSGDKFPYLIALDFDLEQIKKNVFKLETVKIINDPHYSETNNKSVFKGDHPTLPSLHDLVEDPSILSKKIRFSLKKTYDFIQPTSFLIGGSDNHQLTFGKPREYLLENQYVLKIDSSIFVNRFL